MIYRFLKYLDVSYNLIESTKGPLLTVTSRGSGRHKFLLDELHLEYNHIKILEKQSLQNFESINKTYFNGNPITHIQVNTNLILYNINNKYRYYFLCNKFTFCIICTTKNIII